MTTIDPLPIVRGTSTVGPGSAMVLREAERRALGFNLVAHPVETAREAIWRANGIRMGEVVAIGEAGGNMTASVGTVVTRSLEKWTKRGEPYAVLWLEDGRTRCEAMCWPRAWTECVETIEDAEAEGAVLLLDVESRGGDKVTVAGARRLEGETAMERRRREVRESGILGGDFVVLDLETTDDGSEATGKGGGSRRGDKKLSEREQFLARQRIVEVGLASFRRRDGAVGGRSGGREHFLAQQVSRLINPGCPIAAESRAIHGITDEMVRGERGFADRAAGLARVLAGKTIVTYNGTDFDVPVLDAEFARAGHPFRIGVDDGETRRCDVFQFVRRAYRGDRGRPKSKQLADQCVHFGVSALVGGESHRAGADAAMTGRLLAEMVRRGIV